MSTNPPIEPPPRGTPTDRPEIQAAALGAPSAREDSGARERTRRAEASERDQLVDRLLSLRKVLPVLAQEMACARRHAAHLRIDNRRLTEQVRELRSELEARHRHGSLSSRTLSLR